MKLQRKFISKFEIKSFSDTGGDMVFEGYGSVFNTIDSYGDSVVKGAFSKAVELANSSERWPAFLSQHGMGRSGAEPLGIFTHLEEDDYGLKFSAKLAETQAGIDHYKLLKMQPRPAIAGMSIGYIPTKWKAGEGEGQPERILQEVDLWEISLVTFPANREAGVTDVKSIENLQSLSEIESYLRDAYMMSRAESKSLISVIKRGLRDAGDKEAKANAELAEAIQRNINLLRG
jgi:HK97 family phage prohead protease